MKIIRPGDPDLARSVHRFQCKECLCVFEAGRSEYQIQHDFRNGIYYSCSCPTCKSTVYMYPEDEKR